MLSTLSTRQEYAQSIVTRQSLCGTKVAPKIYQSPLKVVQKNVSELSQRCVKVVSKMCQNCIKLVTQFCKFCVTVVSKYTKIVAKLFLSYLRYDLI